MPFDVAGYWFPPTTVAPDELDKAHPQEYKYRDPIPEYVHRTPRQLLDAYYRDVADEEEDDDANIMFIIPPMRCTVHSEDVAWPRSAMARWLRPGGLQVVPVPVEIPGGDPISGFSKVAIEFRNLNKVYPSKGIPLGALYSEVAPGMESPSENVFETITSHRWRPWGDISLVIAWPGYGPERRIAMAYAAFFKKVEDERRLSSRVDFFNIALRQGRNARPDTLGVQLVQLHLVRFRNTVGGFWVADIEVA